MITEELSSNTVSELKDIAKAVGLSGYSSMRKDQLVTLIEENQAPPSVTEAEDIAEETAKAPVESHIVAPPPETGKPPVNTVSQAIALVRDAKRAGYKTISVPYVNEKVSQMILAELTPAERKIAVFGGASRGIVG